MTMKFENEKRKLTGLSLSHAMEYVSNEHIMAGLVMAMFNAGIIDKSGIENILNDPNDDQYNAWKVMELASVTVTQFDKEKLIDAIKAVRAFTGYTLTLAKELVMNNVSKGEVQTFTGSKDKLGNFVADLEKIGAEFHVGVDLTTPAVGKDFVDLFGPGVDLRKILLTDEGPNPYFVVEILAEDANMSLTDADEKVKMAKPTTISWRGGKTEAEVITRLESIGASAFEL